MATSAPTVQARSTLVTATGLLTFLLSAAYAVLGIQLIRAGVSWAEQAGSNPVATFVGLGPGIAIALGIAFLPPALLGFVAGWGLLRRRRWGRVLTFAMAALAVLFGLVWVRGGDGEPADLALGGVLILYGIFALVVLARSRAEFSAQAKPVGLSS